MTSWQRPVWAECPPPNQKSESAREREIYRESEIERSRSRSGERACGTNAGSRPGGIPPALPKFSKCSRAFWWSWPLSGEHGTYKTVKAEFWPWLSG